MGGGYSFRDGMPSTVTGLRIQQGTWGYGPIDVKCSVMSAWEAKRVTVDAGYRVTVVGDQPCNTEGGS